MPEPRNLFKQFVSSMDAILREGEGNSTAQQKAMLNKLFALENKFKKLLLSHDEGRAVYKKFMRFILEDKGNMLSARVYFRERQDTFSNKMFNAFHKKNSRMLHKFKINFIFIQWVLDSRIVHKNDKNGELTSAKIYKNYKGNKTKELLQIKDEVSKIRNDICQNNLPLAINRAKIFWCNTPKSHLDYMDFIQTASEGLINAIDKFVPPYRTVFRSTAIGRMTLNMITDYSDTLVKIPPKEKRIIYRAGNAKKQNITDADKVVDFVNESFKGVTKVEIAEIEMAVAHAFNINGPATDSAIPLAEKLSDGRQNIEENLEAKQTKSLLERALAFLTALEKKILNLKYGDFTFLLKKEKEDE